MTSNGSSKAIATCFNEAAGIHRRKRGPESLPFDAQHGPASMRPPEFTGGNSRGELHVSLTLGSFNEAAGIHRRKLPTWPVLAAAGGMLQ